MFTFSPSLYSSKSSTPYGGISLFSLSFSFQNVTHAKRAYREFKLMNLVNHKNVSRARSTHWRRESKALSPLFSLPFFVFPSSMLVSGIGVARSGRDISIVWRGVFSVHIRRCAKPSLCFCACTLPGSPAAWHSPGLWATGSIPLFRLLHRKCLPV